MTATTTQLMRELVEDLLVTDLGADVPQAVAR